MVRLTGILYLYLLTLSENMTRRKAPKMANVQPEKDVTKHNLYTGIYFRYLWLP
jgi:hypothetical protein